MIMSQTIKRTALFHAVDMETIDSLAKQCHQKNYTKGRDLFAMGDPADLLFIILSGWVKLYRTSKEGEEVIIHVFGPGESFAEAAVFGDGKIYPVNAQAVDDVTLIEIPRSFFTQKIEKDSRFALRMLGAIAARQHYLVQQLEQVTTRTAPQRIGAFLIRFCQKIKHAPGGWAVRLPYDKSIISTRLNIKPETFSRALAKLEPYGVELQGRDIVITDMFRLAEFCDVPVPEIPC
ncbi:MAG: Crp/Fnr family transcriptional regulator [Alphaproteobacteria bacterium]|nr:Crp/Fnr family transcriptional regulator [Alphaproteobacteria bacterium]